MKTPFLLLLGIITMNAQVPVIPPVQLTQSITLPPLNVLQDGVNALDTFLISQISSIPTTLAAAVGLTDTSITVTDATNIPSSGEILIDQEAMSIQSVTSNTVGVTRADLGTSATTHASGVNVSLLEYASIPQLFTSILSQYVGGLMVQYNEPSVAAQLSAIQSIETTAVQSSVTNAQLQPASKAAPKAKPKGNQK